MFTNRTHAKFGNTEKLVKKMSENYRQFVNITVVATFVNTEQ